MIQNPQDWPSTGGFGTEGNRIQTELIECCDAVLMGRHTYDGFAPVWSAASGDPLSDRMNAITKCVVSTTLTEPTWHNTTVIDHDPIETIRELKHRPGADIVQYGFGPLAHALMTAGLLDDLRLWIHPFFGGTGTPGGPAPPCGLVRNLRARQLERPRQRHRRPRLPGHGPLTRPEPIVDYEAWSRDCTRPPAGPHPPN